MLTMSIPRPVKEAFVQDSKTISTPKISKSLVVFLAATQFIFGFNLGFVKQMKNEFKMAAQLGSVAMGLAMFAYLTYMVAYSVWGLIYSIQYFLTFLVLAASSYTLYEFLLDMITIKTQIREDLVFENIGIVTLMYTSLMICFKMLTGMLYHLIIYDKEFSRVTRVVYLVPIVGLDTISIALFLVFYHVYVKLKQLKLGLQHNKITVLEVQTSYRAVIDILDKVRSTIDKLIVLGFIADGPKWIVTIWCHLHLMKTTESWILLCCSYAFALQLTIQMCVPAVCAELVCAETDALHVLAHERLLDERDEDASRSLSQLASYLRARPPLRAAWRLLPTGLRLPTTMLSMCATYLIVVVQFTHLYD